MTVAHSPGLYKTQAGRAQEKSVLQCEFEIWTLAFIGFSENKVPPEDVDDHILSSYVIIFMAIGVPRYPYQPDTAIFFRQIKPFCR